MNILNTSRSTIDQAERIVIKVGSILVAEQDKGTARTDWLQILSQDIDALIKKGKQIVLVSSGAIALGRNSLNIKNNKSGKRIKLEQKQAAAAIGQITLFGAWHDAFRLQNRQTAQILISPHDTEKRRSFLNARATIETLLEHNIIPVINENDTTATDEIRFGDNDKLAARISQMISADLLLILSSTDGLYTADPQKDVTAQHIPMVKHLDSHHMSMGKDATSALSTGGMKSKLEAAKIAVDAGAHVIIASGLKNHPISNIEKSTLILPQDTPHTARKKWLQATLKPKGAITIDNGALKALKNGKSLLPAGVTNINRAFSRGDAVEILDKNNHIVALGLSTYDSLEAEKIIGHKSEDIEDILGYAGREVLVHRNDMVLKE